MIVKMKKYSFLVYHKHYLEFLERIKEIGVLHVIEKPEGIAEYDELRDKLQVASRIKSVLRRLEALHDKNTALSPCDNSRKGLELLIEVENAIDLKESLSQKLILIEKERERMEVWGDFSHERIAQLEAAGFELNFFSSPTRKFDQEWELLYNAFEIDTIGNTIYFVCLTAPGSPIDIDADKISLSNQTAEELDLMIREVRALIEDNNTTLKERAYKDFNTLKATEIDVMTDIAFEKVLLNTDSEADDKVKLIEAWCPEESETGLTSYLDTSDIYYQTSDPEADEVVPVKLKNNRFNRMFEFIGELYDLPNYHEMDLTPFFAPFYMIFFGFCLGDAGYGILLFLLGLYGRSKMKAPIYRQVMTLLASLGVTAFIVGIISGTFFGIPLMEVSIPWLQKIKVFMLSPDKLFYNALILGIIQILFGMILKGIAKINRYGFMAALPILGWLLLFFGCGTTYGLVHFQILTAENAKWLYILFGSLAGICVFLLNDMKRNPLINIGVGFWETYNMATGLLGDTLSYIRLFAIGLSGGVMGLVFNDLAINMGVMIDIPVLSQIITLFILIFGHSINIFIAVLGSFVHPMRLTFVEFYKNAGFEGGGKKYTPFAQYKEETKIL